MVDFDTLIKNGTVYDGSGSAPIRADLGILGDKIAKIGDLQDEIADKILDATGLAVVPGFINMLSWSVESLIEDGRSLGGLHQGVTLEVLGEGWSWGPLNERMKKEIKNVFNSEIEYEVTWNTLGEYLQYLEDKGISVNVASFVGATTLRIYAIGHEDRDPTGEEMDLMKKLATEAMEEGALGIGSSLIYAPAFYAKTKELVELCKIASDYGGMYITHMRSEGDAIAEALDEVITIAKQADLPAEIYHLKLAGKHNWHRLDEVISKIEEARDEGVKLTTDMYLYTAAGTGLHATLPPWVLDGGFDRMVERLSDPDVRLRIISEIQKPSKEWENIYLAASPRGIRIASIKKPELKQYMGQTIQQVADQWGKTPENTICDLLVDAGSWIGCIYFIINEDNLRRQIKLPYMSFASDGASMAPEGVFIKSNAHPRAYGNVPRLLGKYVRDEGIISMEEAIHRLTKLPASNLKLESRGMLKEGYFADVVVFDPETIEERATFDEPHQLSKGVKHVLVNGKIVLKNDEHTGEFSGRFLRGPGYKK